jgi:hypothetical protein
MVKCVGKGVAGIVLALTVAGSTACSAAAVGVPVPTFPAAAPTTTSAPGRVVEGGNRLPGDCQDLVGSDELVALFGLPVGSVAAQTVVGAPAPSVGRLERLSCTYTVSGFAAPRQGVVLRMTVGAYRDSAAAREQHERNVVDEGVGASNPERPELGGAAAALVRRGGESVLLTSFDTVTLDLDLVPQPTPVPPTDLLVDLARRVLARMVPSQPHEQADGTSP